MKLLTAQKGFSLITAIFIVVIVASIAVFMVSIGQVQQQTTALSLLGQRGLSAAGSGLEWGIRRVIQDGVAGLNCTTPPTAPGATAAFNIDTGTTFNVVLTCSVQAFEEGTTSYNVYSLASTAQLNSFGSPDYIQRNLRASVCVNCP